MLSVSKLERQATSGPQKGQSLILFTVHNVTDCILASSIYPSVGWNLLAERNPGIEPCWILSAEKESSLKQPFRSKFQ